MEAAPSSFPFSHPLSPLHPTFPPTNHKLTCSALLLVCPVLTVPLSIASPWQRNTFAGSPSAIKLLWWTGLSACCVRGRRWKTAKGERAQRREEDREERGKWTADEKVGVGVGDGWKKTGAKRETEWRQGEQNERRNGEEAKDRERRDSQSMKQFDNLVILLLKSIPSQRPAIKLDTERQRNKEAGTLSGRHKARKIHTHIHKLKKTWNTQSGKYTQHNKEKHYLVCM